MSEREGCPLQGAMRMVKAAVQLDAEGRALDAYRAYLSSIAHVSQALLAVAQERPAANGATAGLSALEDKLLRLVEHSVERARATGTSLPAQRDHCAGERGADVDGGCPPGVKTAAQPGPESTVEGDRPLPKPRTNILRAFPSPTLFQKQQQEASVSFKRKLGPVEEARVQNMKLMAAYRARMSRLNPRHASAKTALNLSLERRMMENLLIAKAQETALQRKMVERRQRLREEADRRLSQNAALSATEPERRSVLARVLEYEQDNEWPRQWKARLRERPDDSALVSALISTLLSCGEHPLTQLLQEQQLRVYKKLHPLVSKATQGQLGDDGDGGSDSGGSGTPEPAPAPATAAPAAAPPATAAAEAAAAPAAPAPSVRSPLGPDVASHGADCGITERTKRAVVVQKLAPESGEERPSVKADWGASPDTRVEDARGVPRDGSFEELGVELTGREGELLRGSDDDEDEEGRGNAALRFMEEQALREHLKIIVNDVHTCMDSLLELCVLAFEQLESPAGRDQCLASLEEAFFKPLWPPLLALFRMVHGAEERALATWMAAYALATPGDLGVPPELRLVPGCSRPAGPPGDAAADVSSSEGDGRVDFPYGAAVEELRNLAQHCCPQRKLDCIVRTTRQVCECVESFYEHQEAALSPPAIGADDLLPILAFVVLRSQLPQLISECAALEEFIHEGYLMGEEGYCLTSVQTALNSVTSLPIPCGQPPT
ncbi:VPS9 domain-containing protein 1 isoform X2 [Lethenteron reissneri]|uniref:VPS9 domain-containing protein 1 isoform X2 n=1 Tax=Lethenteron reissneri TaxID=7753 RepID=UPI002AB611B3|nr:VPS9 domain-containing protein 1 isoform X2 [Lethenteron reissneri]